VRGNVPLPLFHPHPGPLPVKGIGSFPLLPPGEENRGKDLRREREINVWAFIGGKRGIFISFSLDRRFQNPYTRQSRGSSLSL
jgi:hypothetical protein